MASKGDDSFGSKKMRAGDLTVTLIRAEGIKGDETFGFGMADPYAVLALGNASRSTGKPQRSRTDTNGGKDPVWNEVFKYHIEHSTDDMRFLHIHLYDRDHFSFDDPLGELKIDLVGAMEDGDEVPSRMYSVYFKKKRRPWAKNKPWGKVELSLSFQEMKGQGNSDPVTDETGKHMDGMFMATVMGTVLGVGQLATGIASLFNNN